MPKFAANLSLLFPELPFLERPAAARAAGFEAVELQFPYDVEAAALATALRDNGLAATLINAPAGDLAGGEVGLAALAGREPAFRDGLERALAYAKALDCPRVHCLAGCPSGDLERAEQVYLENLRYAAERARPAGVTIMIEPINRHDWPGFFLATCAQARSVIGRLGAANVALQFDFYHAHIMEPDPLGTFAAQLEVIEHVQVSGYPGRHEPDQHQEIGYPRIFAEIDRLGYDGWVGCEYRPRADTRNGLAWIKAYGLEKRTSP